MVSRHTILQYGMSRAARRVNHSVLTIIFYYTLLRGLNGGGDSSVNNEPVFAQNDSLVINRAVPLSSPLSERSMLALYLLYCLPTYGRSPGGILGGMYLSG